MWIYELPFRNNMYEEKNTNCSGANKRQTYVMRAFLAWYTAFPRYVCPL